MNLVTYCEQASHSEILDSAKHSEGFIKMINFFSNMNIIKINLILDLRVFYASSAIITANISKIYS